MKFTVFLMGQTNFDCFAVMILGVEIEIVEAKGICKLAQDKRSANTAHAEEHLNNMNNQE